MLSCIMLILFFVKDTCYLGVCDIDFCIKNIVPLVLLSHCHQSTIPISLLLFFTRIVPLNLEMTSIFGVAI